MLENPYTNNFKNLTELPIFEEFQTITLHRILLKPQVVQRVYKVNYFIVSMYYKI